MNSPALLLITLPISLILVIGAACWIFRRS
jgi:hypothetical protein